MEDQLSLTRILAQDLPALVFRLYPGEKKMLLLNNMVEHLTGYREDELCAGDICFLDPLIHEPDREKTITEVRRAIREKSAFSIEYRLRHKDGTTRHVLERGQPILQKDGSLLYVDGIVLDITERRSAEEALRLSEQAYRDLIETIPHGIQEIDTRGTIAFANDAHAKMYGYTLDELIGKSILDFSPTDEERRQLEGYLAYLISEQPVPRPWTGTDARRDGTLIDVQVDWNYKRDSDGKVIGFVSVITDVSERNRILGVLRESEARFRSIFDKASIGMALVDTEGRVIVANDSDSLFLGYTKEELAGMHFTTFTHPDDIKKDEELYRSLLEGRRDSYVIDKRYIRKDGQVVWGRLTVSLVKDSNGKAQYTVVLCEDINERKRIEEELLNAQKLESLGTLAAGIAHDFNNLLTGILGSISLAQQAALTAPDRLLKRLEVAENAAMRAQDLTLQLLTFAKGGTPVKKAIAVGSLVREACAFALRGSKVKCVCEVSDDVWPVEADEGQMIQVINNLVINADQAMPDGGIVTVRCENALVEEGSAIALKAGNFVRISIEDRGVGIAEDHIGRIFDPFFTTKQKGSGLGLSTAYSIVRKHEGTITVTSTPGQGSRFSVYLPASAMPAMHEELEETGTSIGEGRILVMDDEELVRNIAGDILSSFGYEVDFALDGNEAIEAYKAAQAVGRPYDLVVMDLTIPGGMGGVETIRHLRLIDPSVKAIVSSGYSNDQILSDFRKHGFSGVVPKPYKVRQLIQSVQNVLKTA